MPIKKPFYTYRLSREIAAHRNIRQELGTFQHPATLQSIPRGQEPVVPLRRPPGQHVGTRLWRNVPAETCGACHAVSP